jgi:hypothetical protein
VARVPGLREALTWNFTVVLRRADRPAQIVAKKKLAKVSLPDGTQ